MWIGHRTHPQVFRTLVGTVPLRKSDKETLLRIKAIDGLKMLVFGGILPRHESENFAAEVGDVFTQRQLAVHVNVLYRNIS